MSSVAAKREVVLYFGSFNPVHNGHTSVAAYVLDQTGLCDELWFVVSPQNPLKDNALLAPDIDRLRMTEIAVNEKLHGRNVLVSDQEFRLPRPSYTIDSVKAFAALYPDCNFSILAGEDILQSIGHWKSYRELLENYRILIYPRDGSSFGNYGNKIVFLDHAPKWDYSSTDVRRLLSEGGNIEAMVAHGVAEYIVKKGLWKI